MRRLSVISCIVISSFCYFSIKFTTDIHLHTHVGSLNKHSAQWASFQMCSVFLFLDKWGKSSSFCFSSSQIQFSFERALCRNAVRAVSTCFIYPSVFKRDSSCSQSFVSYALTSKLKKWRFVLKLRLSNSKVTSLYCVHDRTLVKSNSCKRTKVFLLKRKIFLFLIMFLKIS